MNKILFINHYSSIGGAETNLLNILKFSNIGRFEPVAVLLPNNGPLVKEIVDLGISVGIINYYSLKLPNPSKFFITLSQLSAWVKKTQPDMIHLNHQWLIKPIMQFSLLNHTPVICHTRNYPERHFVIKNKNWFRKADAIIFESKVIEKAYQELKFNFVTSRIISNGVDFHHILKNTVQKTENSQEVNGFSSPRIGFSGRIVPEKGPEILIRAVPLVLKKFPSAQFIFCGSDDNSGEYINHLKSLAEDLKITNNTQFLGFQKDIVSMISTFDVLVVPSLPDMLEGLPLTIIEGLAAGCIIVSTSNGGTAEVVIDKQTGFIVPPNDPIDTARCIIEALSLSQQDRNKIISSGRKLIQDNYQIEQQVEKLGELYREILEKKTS